MTQDRQTLVDCLRRAEQHIDSALHAKSAEDIAKLIQSAINRLVNAIEINAYAQGKILRPACACDGTHDKQGG